MTLTDVFSMNEGNGYDGKGGEIIGNEWREEIYRCRRNLCVTKFNNLYFIFHHAKELLQLVLCATFMYFLSFGQIKIMKELKIITPNLCSRICRETKP